MCRCAGSLTQSTQLGERGQGGLRKWGEGSGEGAPSAALDWGPDAQALCFPAASSLSEPQLEAAPPRPSECSCHLLICAVSFLTLSQDTWMIPL